MKNILDFIPLLFLGLLITSCTGQTVPGMDTKTFAEKCYGENAILLDVRTPEEYAEGHLKGALLINYHDADFLTQVAKLDTTKTVFVYCRSGRRSGDARIEMLKMNFRDVINLEGGIVSWKENGLPVVIPSNNE